MWCADINPRLAVVRSQFLRNSHKLRDELYAIRNRLIANGIPFHESTYAAAEAVVKTVSKLIADQPETSVINDDNLFISTDDLLKGINDIGAEQGDLAIAEWLKFEIDTLASSLDKAVSRALRFSLSMPPAAVIVFPPELFRRDYRKDLFRVRNETEHARKRLAEIEEAESRHKFARVPAKILRTLYGYPCAAFDSAIGLLDGASNRHSKKAPPQKIHLWKSGVEKRIEAFDKALQRRGLLPHDKDIEMKSYYIEKLHRLNIENEYLLEQFARDCEEAEKFLALGS